MTATEVSRTIFNTDTRPPDPPREVDSPKADKVTPEVLQPTTYSRVQKLKKNTIGIIGVGTFATLALMAYAVAKVGSFIIGVVALPLNMIFPPLYVFVVSLTFYGSAATFVFYTQSLWNRAMNQARELWN